MRPHPGLDPPSARHENATLLLDPSRSTAARRDQTDRAGESRPAVRGDPSKHDRKWSRIPVEIEAYREVLVAADRGGPARSERIAASHHAQAPEGRDVCRLS